MKHIALAFSLTPLESTLVHAYISLFFAFLEISCSQPFVKNLTRKEKEKTYGSAINLVNKQKL